MMVYGAPPSPSSSVARVSRADGVRARAGRLLLPAAALLVAAAPVQAAAARHGSSGPRPKPAASPRPKPAAGLLVKPGIYLSASVALSLEAGGAFLVQELGGTRRASGRYAIGAGTLVFKSGEGDVGKTRFPLTCRLVGIFDGFAVAPAQPDCRPFNGLSFRTAT